MGVNFSAFEIGRRALRASQLGITVTGQNVANVNTPGYTRQSVQQSPTPVDGSNLRLTGVGVTIDGVRSFRDQFVESRLQAETGITGRLTARRDALAPVDATFNETNGGGINSALNGFFGSFRDLEAHPNSVPLRAAAVAKGTELATAFNTTRARLVEIRSAVDEGLRSTVDDVNTLAGQMADLNKRVSIAEGSGSNALELRDQRSEVVRQLSELAGTRAVEGSDGMVTLAFADGRHLVTGTEAVKLEAVSGLPDGLATLMLDGAPASLSDGRLRGLQDAIATIGEQIASLDDLAAAVADRVNTVHASGSDLDGNDGANFFEMPGGGAPVTAGNIKVSAALKADPRGVVAAARNAGSGDGSVARELSGLLTDPNTTAGARTGSFTSIYGSLVAEAGAGVKSAEDALATQQVILAQATAQRDAASGVSLDEEAINLLQYQRAFEAAARFLRVADEMTQAIIALGQ